MIRRNLLASLAATALLPGLPGALADTPPNILWIFSDDLAVQAIGAYGGRFEKLDPTPNIDRLAREGMVFDRAYVANSICAPSRATLLTGKHSHMNGKFDNRDTFDHGQQQVQKLLQKAGYQTALIGKIHINGQPEGFDHWEVLPGQGKYTDPDMITAEGKKIFRGHATDVITERALSWLESGRKPDKPFLLMVHHKAPHRNWHPADRHREKFRDTVFPEPETLFDDHAGKGVAAHEQKMAIAKDMTLPSDLKLSIWPDRKQEFEAKNPAGDDLVRWKYQTYMRDYFACVAGVDESVGQILKALDERGLTGNTVVMVSSDQGFYLGERGWFDKRFMYEESFRTPLIARWPGVIRPGSRNSDLVQNIDTAETFLDIAGAPIPPDMQGLSFVPLLKGQTPATWRTSLYYHYYEFPGTHSVRRHEGVATKRHKLIRFYGPEVPGGEEWEFYDLQTDPGERTNRIANPESAGTIRELKSELDRLRKQYQVPEGEHGPPVTRGKRTKEESAGD